jgi:tetratricopeptide (TPR) repeat protein
LFFSGFTSGLSFLLGGLIVGATGKAWDDSPAGQDGALARTARAAAKASVKAPVTVIIDDADFLDENLAITLVENLTARQGSQVLVIAVVDPGSILPNAVRSRVRQGLTSGLVFDAEADPDMAYESRLELARQLRPNLPDRGARRIAQRTTTFAEVFTVAAAPRLAEIWPGEDADAVQAIVDAAASGRLTRPAPSPEATVIAWAGGLVHTRQADRALGILDATRITDDTDVRRWESLERLADPAAPRLADQVAASLTGRQRRAMAAAFLQEALTLNLDPGASLIGRVAALQAAHRVRGDMQSDPSQLRRAQRELVAALEALGDHAAALDVAGVALAEWDASAGDRDDRNALAAAMIRLSRTTPQRSSGPLVEQLIRDAITDGAATGLEARVWATATLLAAPGQREAAIALSGQLLADLDARPDLGEAGDRWRLLLAAHTARAGQPGIAGQLLAPLLSSADPGRHRPARTILDAGDGPRADIRLQNILLAEELSTLQAEAEDDRLRLHHALAANHATLGDYRQALPHAQQEFGLRCHIQGADHPDTLTARANIAIWTGWCGDAHAAVDLLRELLPHQERVLGHSDRKTLATRNNIAYWTGECGDAPGTLALYVDLLPDLVRVLGSGDLGTLTARNNIASWTGQVGDMARALALALDLLPDLELALGPHHSLTLTARSNIASWTGQVGDAAGALALSLDLLPDMEQALGPGHPNTLTLRCNIAIWTATCGDAGTALGLLREVLSHQQRLLGPNHPSTTATSTLIARISSRYIADLMKKTKSAAEL